MPGLQLLRLVIVTLLVTVGLAQAQAQPLEKRIALVIGNGAYQAGALATPANDAGLVAQTLQAAGFDVVGARDLDMATFRASLREFIDKANASGPDTVAFVYFAGHGLQFEGENYLVPVDARIARDSDVPLEAIRLSDLVRPLAGLPLKARIVVLDAARQNGFARSGQPLAGGLALAQPDAGVLLAFNAAPGTIAPEAKEGYGAYAAALTEMIKEGGLKLDDLFERVRLRVDGLTQGAELAWHVSRVEAPFLFFERAQGAPVQAERFSELRSRPIREFDPRQAYLAAVARDSMRGYQDFLAAYPDDPLARRVRAIVAARREATTWRESALADTREGYWSYLRRYPRGPHAYDARRRLAHLAAALEPPATFAALSYDVPPPPPEEVVYVERPVVYLADPVYELPPPPPVPVIFLPPRPTYFVELAPPPPPDDVYVLPVPVYHPVESWVERPRYVAPPPANIVSVNIHNTVAIDQSRQTVIVTNPAGQQLPPASAGLPDVPQSAPGQPALSSGHPGMAAAVVAAAAAALPAAVALRAASQRSKPNALQGTSAPASGPGQTQPAMQPPQASGQPPAQALPAQQARPPQPPQSLSGQAVPSAPGAAKPSLAGPGTPPAGANGPASASRPVQPSTQGAQPLPQPQPNQPGLATGDKSHAAAPAPGAVKPSLATPSTPPVGANGSASASRPVQPSTQGAQPLPQPNQPGLATGDKSHAAAPAPGAAKPSLVTPGSPPAGANGPASASRPVQPSTQGAQPLPQPNQPGLATGDKSHTAPSAPGAVKPSLAAPGTPPAGASGPAAASRPVQGAQPLPQPHPTGPADAGKGSPVAAPSLPPRGPGAIDAAQQQRAQQAAQAARDQQQRAQQAAQQQRAQQQAAQAARDQQMRAQQQAAAQQRQAMQAAQQQRAQQQAAQAARGQQMRAQQQAAAQQRQAMQAAQQQRAQQQAAQAARDQQMRAQQQAAQQHQMMQMQQQRAAQAAQQQQRAAQAAAQQRQMMQRQAAPQAQGGPHGRRRPDCGNPGQPPCR